MLEGKFFCTFVIYTMNGMSCCDEITKRFFEHKRWEKALDVGVNKGISKVELRDMAKPEVRISLYRAIIQGGYRISPPRTALIPKDSCGNYRMVYINKPADRVILSIANDLLFDLTPDMIHPSCKSYISGVGCGKVVQEVSRRIAGMSSTTGVVGWKSDLSKYFDSVAIEHIDHAFDMVESRYGKSALIDMIRKYYHDDTYVDEHGEEAHKYMSLRQGCAVSSWLADVLLRDIDERLSGLQGYYVRYCDDMLYVGPDCEEAMQVLIANLDKMGLRLNPKKIEMLSPERWFSFLGYSIKGQMISLSSGRVKKFQQSIDRVTSKARSMAHAIIRVNRFLYKGNGEFSWSTLVLPVVNVAKDLDTLNAYVMDAIRAAKTGKRRIGGLGYDRAGSEGCIVRGRGRHVGNNRAKTPQVLERYRSLTCMRKAMKTSRAAYDTIVRQM